MEAKLEKYKAEVTPAMLRAGMYELDGAIPEHEMWDVESLVKGCWAAMRLAAAREAGGPQE